MAFRDVVISVAAFAAAMLALPAYASEKQATSDTQLGTYLKHAAGRVLKISPATKYLNAEHYETVTFEDDKGQRFSWQFDTQFAPTGFPLRRIAPLGFNAGKAWVYVDHPPRHVAID